MTFYSPIGTPKPLAVRLAFKKRVASLAPLLTLVSLLGLCLAPVSAFAIESPYLATDALAAEQATAEEFSTFPAPARRAGLVVAGYPESLLEIQRLQQNSADRFAALVESYPRETQAQVWDLVRYPGLAADLARGGKKSSNQLDDLANRYPDADHLAILEEGKERHDLWVQIYSLDLESQQSLSTILAAEPVEVQAAFDEVTARPDLMSLLAENIRWTTIQGSAYRENAAQVDARFATLAEQVAARDREAETNWANEVTDPESAEELETAAREFADTYGYDYEEELDASPSRQASSNTTNTTIIIEQRVNPYPYWSGYPTWYDSAFWYPLSFSSHIGFGYHNGFGRGFGRRYASFGLPSPFFLGWYHDIYQPRFARNHNGNRGHRRSIRYYDNHRPHRSASHRRHASRRDGRRDHVDSLRDRARVERRDNRRGNRRDNRRDTRFEVKRDRRSHTGALADRALRERRQETRTERRNDPRLERRDRRDPDKRNDRTLRGDRSDRSEKRERRSERNLRSQAREQARFTRDDRDDRGIRGDRENRNDPREKRDVRADKRLRNPEIRPGGRPAQRISERKNDGVRTNSPKIRQARADVPRLSKKERKAERRVERAARKAERRAVPTDRKADRRVARTERKADRRVVRAERKAERRVVRTQQKSAKRIARAERRTVRSEARASSGGGGSRKGQRQGGGGKRNNGGKRGN